mmetsp:Transcript_993/g.3237  ORF Transcript_993/g.3237 Transcript_993/m.3237 type:complete len:279 (-) Transcript_993:96-932(-)
MVYLPYWMMQNLLLGEGDILRVAYTTLPKGTFVKLRPQTKDFLDISNPKAVLETTMRGYTCLTVNDTILINYNNKRYFIDIVEAKPGNAISIVDTDCEVDFAPPLDYVEPEPEFRNAMDTGTGVNGLNGAGSSAGSSKKSKTDPGQTDAKVPPSAEGPTFLAFAGGGNRMDGKSGRSDLSPVEVELPTTSLKLSKEFEKFIRGPSGDQSGKKKETNEGASGLPRRKAGKLVFGGAPPGGVGRESRAEAKAVEKKDEKKQAENGDAKFSAFQGSGNKLK